MQNCLPQSTGLAAPSAAAPTVVAFAGQAMSRNYSGVLPW